MLGGFIRNARGIVGRHLVKPPVFLKRFLQVIIRTHLDETCPSQSQTIALESARTGSEWDNFWKFCRHTSNVLQEIMLALSHGGQGLTSSKVRLSHAGNPFEMQLKTLDCACKNVQQNMAALVWKGGHSLK